MSNVGVGYVVFDVLVTGLLWVAAVLQIAVLRDRSVNESRFAESCRWLITAGVTGIALRFTFVLYDAGDIRLPPFSLSCLAVLAVGLIGRPLEQLMLSPPHRRFDDAQFSVHSD